MFRGVALAGCGAGSDTGWRATGACGGMGVCICVHVWAVGGRCSHACVLLRRRLDAVVYSAHIAYYHTQFPSPTTATSPNNEDILEHFGGLNANSLVHLLHNNTDNDEPDFMQLSSYHDDDSLNTMFNIKADSFSILSLNCQSLNAKFDQINIKVQQLRSEGHEFKVICLQETWLSDDSETALFQIQEYNLVQHGKQCSAHGGLAIYISTKLNFSTVDININSQVWEGQFIEISNIETNKTLIIGNLYRPPHNTNDLYQTFINEFIPILEHLQRVNREVIIAGDFNIDLLKINENATLGDYFNSLVAQSCFPQITLPTRFSDRNCTIIDNFLCKLTHNFKPSTTGILISRISDHLPYFIFLDFITAKRDYIKKKYKFKCGMLIVLTSFNLN